MEKLLKLWLKKQRIKINPIGLDKYTYFQSRKLRNDFPLLTCYLTLHDRFQHSSNSRKCPKLGSVHRHLQPGWVSDSSVCRISLISTQATGWEVVSEGQSGNTAVGLLGAVAMSSAWQRSRESLSGALGWGRAGGMPRVWGSRWLFNMAVSAEKCLLQLHKTSRF